MCSVLLIGSKKTSSDDYKQSIWHHYPITIIIQQITIIIQNDKQFSTLRTIDNHQQ